MALAATVSAAQLDAGQAAAAAAAEVEEGVLIPTPCRSASAPCATETAGGWRRGREADKLWSSTSGEQAEFLFSRWNAHDDAVIGVFCLSRLE